MGKKLYYSNIMFSRGRPSEIAPGTLHEREDGPETAALLEDEYIRQANEAEIALYREMRKNAESEPTPAPAGRTSRRAAASAPAADDLVG